MRTSEAAHIIGVTPAKVAEYCRTGRLPCIRTQGKKWRIRNEQAARDLRYQLTDGERRPIPGKLE